ncbi:uncharacterized protein LOC134013785 isoform X1 [Osmerus eperlanus]|uniref:uncharacterized protein LOC134013785 isoform X1 n=1 Tax=Osmerus eperlanus TaxID=29151 RepID=UPI002E11441B
MQLTQTITVFGSLCFQLCKASTDLSQDGPPKILGPKNNLIYARKGMPLRLNCMTNSKFSDFSVIYWLVNGTFLNQDVVNGRITETEESGECEVLQSSLKFTTLLPEDFRSTITCVAISPAGRDQKNFKLRQRPSQRTRSPRQRNYRKQKKNPVKCI